MDYTVEKDGGGVRLLLANGDRLLVKLTIGNVSDTGTKNPDGTPIYNVQAQPSLFFIPPAAASSGKH